MQMALMMMLQVSFTKYIAYWSCCLLEQDAVSVNSLLGFVLWSEIYVKIVSAIDMFQSSIVPKSILLINQSIQF